MFNSDVLNVVIGLTFIYLLYSLLATIINEMIASAFELRAKKLKVAIIRMLKDEQKRDTLWSFIRGFVADKYKTITKFLSFFQFKKPGDNQEKLKKLQTYLPFLFKEPGKTNNETSLSESFYKHPGIKYLGVNRFSNKPSYISNEFFSKVLIDVLKENGGNTGETPVNKIQKGIDKISESPDTQKFIQSLLTDANHDLEKFQASIEQWFDETMKRTTGWYKRQSQRIMICIGLVLAFSFNVDTISIVNKLSNDPNAAKALADLAGKYAETHKDASGNVKPTNNTTADSLFNLAIKQVNGDIRNANSVISLGWDIPTDTNQCIKVKGTVNPINDSVKVKATPGAKKGSVKVKATPGTKKDSIKLKSALNTIKDSIKAKNEPNKLKTLSCITLDTKKDSVNCRNYLRKIRDSRIYVSKGSSQLTYCGKIRYVWYMAWHSGRRLMGFLITALAISLGAPFWFDLLSKFMKLRYTGKKPDEPVTLKTDKKEKSAVKTVG